MSEQDGAKVTRKRHKSQPTHKRNGLQAPVLHNPKNEDIEAWKAFWKKRGQPWRTEPEIVDERQKYLAERRNIVPDIEQGSYPFKDINLSRADVEWLLATHENGRGPVDWNDESQRNRQGLDLRGAILRSINLSALPLARLRGGLKQEELRHISKERCDALIDAAAIHLEEEVSDSIVFDWRFVMLPDNEGLCNTHLEGAELCGAYFTRATLFGTFLMGANLYKAHLENTDLRHAYLEEADLDSAYLMKAQLANSHLTRGKLAWARMDEAWLPEADLEGADLYEVSLNKAYMYKACLKGVRFYNASLKGAELREVDLSESSLTKASLEGASLVKAHLERANLYYTHLEGADLSDSHLEGAQCYRAFFDDATKLNGVFLSDEKYGCVSLGEVSWGSVNITVVDWTQLKVLGDELQAYQKDWNNGEIKKPEIRHEQFKAAIRANRQLAVVLKDQGLNEEADHFAYRGVCQVVCVNPFLRTGFASLSSRQVRALHLFPSL